MIVARDKIPPWVPWAFILLVLSALLGWSGIVGMLTLLGKVVEKLSCVLGFG